MVMGTVVTDSQEKVNVQVIGLDRTIPIDSNGHFTVRLPSGAHTLRFEYSRDTASVEVRLPPLSPGAKQNIGVVVPPFSQGFPLPPPCPDSACEMNALLHLLHDDGLDTVRIDSVCRWENGHITALFLRRRGIAVLSPVILAFPLLQTLDLGGNPFAVDPFRIIGSCTRLTGLYLDSCALTYLPSTLGQLRSLKRLVLSDNEISVLPISIVDLSPDFVDLANNRLLDLTGVAAQWADTHEPGWRSSQRATGPDFLVGSPAVRGIMR
jgi:hypothetical protein